MQDPDPKSSPPQSPIRSLLVSLYQHSEQHRSAYKTLEKFRERIEHQRSGPHHLPYHFEKNKMWIYQLIFAVFALFFLGLAVFIFFYTKNLSYQFLHMQIFVPKALVAFITLSLGLSAGWIAWRLSAEREAAYRLIDRAKKRLRYYYRKQLGHLAGEDFSSLLKRYKQTSLIRHHYRETVDQIEECRDITFILFEKINQSQDEDLQTKEALYNEALLELNDNLNVTLEKFKQTLRETHHVI